MDEAYRTELFCSALKIAGLRNAKFHNRKFSVDSLQTYFDEVYGQRSSRFSAAEFCYFKDKLGNRICLLPELLYWPRLAYLRYIADVCRKDLPLRIAWAWRPQTINDEAGGSRKSAHLLCCAMDIDTASREETDRILANAIHPMYNDPIGPGSTMGLGVGATRLHVDFFSPEWEERNNHRWWGYDSNAAYGGPRMA